jgi:5-methylcytosine-specific restriction protein B
MDNKVYLKKLTENELGYRKNEKKGDETFFISQKVWDYFPCLSEQTLNDHTSLNLYCSEKEEPVLVNLTYHNSKLSEKKKNGRNEYRLYLPRALTKEISFKPGDIISLSRIETDSYSLELFKNENEIYDPLNKIIQSSKIRGGHAMISHEEYDLIKTKSTLNQNLTPIPLNQILYGPPGTGKTYSTIDRALDILDRASQETDPKKKRAENLETFKTLLNKKIFFVTMHPSYGYEDFVQGIRPKVFEERNAEGEITRKDLIFENKDGIFKRVAEKAQEIFIEDGVETKKNIENKDVAKVCCFMAMYNTKGEQEANAAMGKSSYKEVYKVLSKLSGLSENYIKQIKDRYDNLFPHRKGHVNKDLKKYNKKILSNSETWPQQDVFDELKEKTFEEVAGIANEILNKPIEEKKVTEENQNFVLILDEINRANISKVFGELITLLEEDKRIGGDNELSVTLPSGEEFSIPPNLYIIGTMNTADKSIALVDIALRRRFQFEALYPNPSVIDEFGKVENSEKKHLMENLNQKLIEPDGEFFKGVDFQIGHAYFLKNNTLNDVVDQNIIPLLTEYFRNDLQKVKALLDACSHKIDNGHFEKTGLLRSK